MLGDDCFDEIIDVLERFDLEQILIVAELDLEGMLNACDQIVGLFFEDDVFDGIVLCIEMDGDLLEEHLDGGGQRR